MTQKKPFSNPEPSEAGSGPVLLGTGKITPEMNQVLKDMKNFNGSDPKVQEHLGNSVIKLFRMALGNLSVKSNVYQDTTSTK